MRTGDPQLRRLALQVQLAAFPGPVLPDDGRRLLEQGLGGVCLFGSNTRHGPDRLRALTDSIHAANPDAVVAVDEEGGDVTRLHDTTGSPHPGAAVLGRVDDLDETRRCAAAVGQELLGAGVDLDLAPVADVNSNPDNPIIGVRSFGADPELAARHVAAWTEGLQSAGVAACAKHFPGHGDTAQDSHTDLPTVDVPVGTLQGRELVPFVAAVQAGTRAVMTSHVLLPAYDADAPATLSPVVLALLRGQLGFGGAVVTDALDMRGASGGRGIPRAAVLAVAAGADLLCLGADKDAALVGSVQDALVRAVVEGELSVDRLADAAARVAAIRTGLGSQAAPAAYDGTDVARRALDVEGTLPDHLDGALVVRVDTEPSIAAGHVPWGLPADVTVTAADPVRILVAASGRPLVVQVREAHRHPWVTGLLADLAAERPDLMVVEMGWPGPLRPRVTRVRTWGASRASTRALHELLQGAR